MPRLPASTTALVVTTAAEGGRWQLRQAVARLAAQVARRQRALQQRRARIARFAARYSARVAPWERRLGRLRRQVARLQRLAALWRQPARPRRAAAPAAASLTRGGARRTPAGGALPAAAPAGADAADPRRARAAPATAAAAAAAESARRVLKQTYRALARRYHPDLAGNATQQRGFAARMVRINALYATGDLAGLLHLDMQASAGAPACDDEATLLSQRRLLRQRAADLAAQRRALRRSAWGRLQRAAVQARGLSRLLRGVKRALRVQLQETRQEYLRQIAELEAAVAQHRRKHALATQRGTGTAEGDALARRGLAALGTVAPPRGSAARAAAALQGAARRRPWLCRLVLLTYVAQRGRLPLLHLETFEALQQRFAALCRDLPKAPADLTDALSRADAWVEFGVQQVTPRLARAGLRFVRDALAAGCAAALEAAAVREHFFAVLQVLGDARRCAACGASVLAIPLFRLRGIDTLRASGCPRCGHIERRYRMPCGDDAQSLFNADYLRLGLVQQCDLQLSDVAFALQGTATAMRALSVGALARQVHAELLQPHGLPVEFGQIWLSDAQGRPLPAAQPLTDAPRGPLRLRFAAHAPLDEATAAAHLQQAVAHRFARR